MFYLALGLVLYVMRPGLPTFFFLLLGVGQTCNYENLNYLHVVRDPQWMPLGMLLGTLAPAAFLSAWLYFGALFGRPAGAYAKSAWYFLSCSVAIGEALYYLHFFTATIWRDPIPFGTYTVTAVITWLLQLAAAVAITLRVNREAPEMRRLRWIAAGVWMQVLFAGVFFVQQSIRGVGFDGTFLISAFAWLLPPGTLCIAYALVRTRVIDVRAVGARTIVYGSLTAIPIALFSIADWFFSRELADARLATFVEFGVAVFFGIWLNTLHKRIDRFVERIVFASRHHAFQRLRHAMHALSSVERSDTATALLCNEPASALRLASAAVFIERGGTFDRVAAMGWSGCAEQVDYDNPLVLFARSQHRTVRLSDVAESNAALPPADARPEIAVPIAENHRIVGVALYGRQPRVRAASPASASARALRRRLARVPREAAPA